MASRTKGEKWIKLLRAYGPVADNEAHQAEHVDRLANALDVPKIAFEHPARSRLLECFPLTTGAFRNVVLTGTAGAGKTSLCFDLIQELTGNAPHGKGGIEELRIETAGGFRKVTLIFDVTAWKKKIDGYLSAEHVDVLLRFAKSAFEESDEFFVLAVNDGQMHELFKALPEDANPLLRMLQTTLIGLHSRGESDEGERLRLVNLSMVPSEKIMRLCLTAVLDRPEWSCLDEEGDNLLFSPGSSLSRNYRTLSSGEVRAKLVTLARIADVTGHHLPTRGVLCLLSNALLGHPDADGRVLRPGPEAARIVSEGAAHRASLHRTLFGENLSPTARRKREVYRFLSMLHIGDETTNDLDEIFIFASRDEELKPAHQELIAVDPFDQRNPDFEALLNRYIRGDIRIDDDDMNIFLSELAAERRRVFLHGTQAQMKNYSLWRTTVFHHAAEYLDEVIDPLHAGEQTPRPQLRKIAAGLNRIWTGMLLTEHANEVFIATGLDLTTSPVSDICLSQIELDSDPPGLQIKLIGGKSIPDLILRNSIAEFRFPLTLSRFEFLCRVAAGAMPSSFSRDSFADFMSLKQRCIRDLRIKAGTQALYLLEVQGAGLVQRHPIHLNKQW